MLERMNTCRKSQAEEHEKLIKEHKIKDQQHDNLVGQIEELK